MNSIGSPVMEVASAICIGVHKDLRSVWIAQGDEVECLEVEVWVDDFPIRVLVAYGP